MTHEWISRLADDERKRDARSAEAMEAAAQQAEVVRRHGRRLVDELRTTMTRDLDAFRQEFVGDQGRDVVLEGGDEGGFSVRKPGHPSASLNVSPCWETASVGCHYRFKSDNGMPPREDTFDLVFAPRGDAAAQFRHNGSGQMFATADALSEFLLTPVLTGRPR